ncbi:hypothetical protein STAQ_39740 [Allostella sp. ATCC 35155]|nr:hypothetical protein STAQ_39740 [Stella sp. ATCC 35155]
MRAPADGGARPFHSRRSLLAVGALPWIPRMAAASPDDRLRHAAESGDDAAVAAAIAAGASLDAADGAGRTALLLAVAAGQDAVALRLVRAGADINAQAANRDTPWLLAGARGRTAVLAAMLDTGRVDYTKRNRYGGNALIPACERGHVETVRLLLERSEIEVDHVNDLGWTALLEAVILADGGPRHVEIVRLLLAHGAAPRLADRDGITALAHARARNQTAVVPLLEAAEAGR